MLWPQTMMQIKRPSFLLYAPISPLFSLIRKKGYGVLFLRPGSPEGSVEVLFRSLSLFFPLMKKVTAPFSLYVP